MVSLALFQPDIPQNTGTLMRLCACLNSQIHIIEPAGFVLSDRNFRRAGMDYLQHCQWSQHASWSHFESWRLSARSRLLLLTTKSDNPYFSAKFQPNDILLLGRESSGAPDYVHKCADLSITIPMRKDVRSINVATAGAIVLGEAIRQTCSWPT